MGLFDNIWARMSFYMRLILEPDGKTCEKTATPFELAMLKATRFQAVIHAETMARHTNYVSDYVWKHDIRKDTPPAPQP